MCNICVFAGTTEGRELAEFLAGQPVQATVCVATEYGETLLPEAENITVLAGRIPVEDIIRMLQETRFDLVIDATHPYATSITESICTACRETETEYLRLLRQSPRRRPGAAPASLAGGLPRSGAEGRPHHRHAGAFLRGDGSGYTAVCRRRMDGDQGRRRSRRLSR